MIKLPVFFLFILTSLRMFSQDVGVFRPDSIKKELSAVKITGSIKIDGELNEEEWKLAKPSSQFIINHHQKSQLSHKCKYNHCGGHWNLYDKFGS